jgi:hypothetical protein
MAGNRIIRTAAAIILIPAVAFAGGAYLIQTLPGKRPTQSAVGGGAVPRALNLRLGGYRPADVEQYWAALGPEGRGVEIQSLRIDLAFPLLYGAAMGWALLTGKKTLRGRASVAWLLPLVATVIADWTENGIQLSQLRAYVSRGASSLDTNLIGIASWATTTKLVLFVATYLIILIVGVQLIVAAVRTSRQMAIRSDAA